MSFSKSGFALIAAVVAVAALDAHVIVSPRESAPGAEQQYSMRVPNEMQVPSLSVDLEVPAGLHVANVPTGEGYTVDLKREKDRIVGITWKREIKPKEFAQFTFTAHNPAAGELQWKAHQHFADGSTIDWVGERGSKQPASVTVIKAPGDQSKTPAQPGETHQH